MFEIIREIKVNKLRSILLLLVLLISLTCIGVYFGNIVQNINLLENISDDISVEMQVVNANGTKSNQLTISGDTAKKLLENTTYTENEVYTIMALGRDELSENSANIPVVGVSNFDENFDSLEENVCVVPKNYAEFNNLKVGDMLTLQIFMYKFTNNDSVFELLPLDKVELEIIDFYESSQSSEIITPIKVLEKLIQNEGEELTYSSFSAKVEDPTNLNEFKLLLSTNGFQEASLSAQEKLYDNNISFDDRLFIETAGPIENMLNMFYMLATPFTLIILILNIVVILMIYRQSLKEIALYFCIGKSIKEIKNLYFYSVLIINAFVSVAGLFVLLIILHSIIWALGLVLLCFMLTSVGSRLALSMLLKTDFVKHLGSDD